ncbi:hypothetical protein CGMCC3_g11405 [Colletotrichum fructicola]|nr:uncharacterized protein CGMCC3_g11405 [Colletotrichum fructicola]KAE9572463.1 hypothetical protein CGMCC3_g11405 [Colletotrichum fructicola]
MPGPIEDYEDELGNLLVADYDEGQDWEAADNLAKIENREILRVLENPAVANPSDDAPVLREFRGDAQIVFLPPDFQPVTNISVDLPPSTLISPRYLYQGQELPAPVDREFRVVQNLLEEHRRTSEGGDDFIDFELDQFTVYTEPYMGGLTEAYEKMRYPAEMRPLQHLSIKPGCTVMYVDGVLSIGDARYFVRQVPFEELPIGNYGLSESTIGREIWIRSKMNTKAADRGKEDVYYRLKNPSPEYRRFHMGFIWVANLGKHVADYLCAALPGNDFRTAIVANLDFIYKEVYGLLGWHKTKSIYMWKEIRDYTAYPDTSKKTPSTPTSGASSPAPGKAAQIDKTIVTPYTYQLFNHLPCGMMMEAMAPSPRAEKLRTDLISAYNNETTSIDADRIHGRCLVRFFRRDEPLLPPYGRNGVGNAFFVTHHVDSSGQIVRMDDAPPTLRQGFDPSRQVPKLRGVDLFCGGGNFGRGLEEGGAIEMQWHQLHPFAGSIDDLQRLALEGKFSDKVPKIGTVDFVSAGSPCPGFSRLTVDKATPEQRKNQSLVAAFASFIDTYRPRYGLLENVLEIVQPRREKNEDVFCQLICALVGLGYQTHFFLLDAWSYGSPQSRSRVFLCFAAPGHKLPEPPLQSHSHYKPDVRLKTLGKLPNDEPMGEHLVMPTPFRFIGSEEATADLPNIIDGKFDICIPFPDHRLAHGYTKYLRNQLSVIPTHPYGMNFTTTWNKGHGIMTKAERDFFPAAGRRVTQASSRAWSRCFPQQVMQTVTTVPSPADARMGRILHWNQSRTLTVMEARRAQGFLDHEVILGQPKDQWRVVVNSVAKEVSLALGLSFREAWIGSLVDEDEADPTLGQQSILNDMNIAQLNTPPGPSSRSTPSAGADALGSSRPPKRSLESTLEVQLFVSKMAKTIADSE